MSLRDELRAAEAHVARLRRQAAAETVAELIASVPAPWHHDYPGGSSLTVPCPDSLLYIWVQQSASGAWTAGANGHPGGWSRERNGPNSGEQPTPKKALSVLLRKLSWRGRAGLCRLYLDKLGITVDE